MAAPFLYIRYLRTLYLPPWYNRAMRRTALVVWPLTLLAACTPQVSPTPSTPNTQTTTSAVAPATAVYRFVVDKQRWPNVANQVQQAQASGKSKTCTLDRPGATDRRKLALQGHQTKDGYDRSEYPFAVCKEGGAGADVALIPSAENRSQGASFGNQTTNLPDGTTLTIEVG